MDPLFSSSPSTSGHFSPCSGVTLFFESRGAATSPRKVIMLMGAFATRRHFEQLAHSIASAEGGTQFEVLTFDYRGVGKSTIASAAQKRIAQTSEVLARDALALLEHVWGSGEEPAMVSVYGASMGGMVAQVLACKLVKEPKAGLSFQNLVLAVTARNYGMARFFPVGARAYRFLLGAVLPRDPAKMVKSLITQVFSKDYITMPHSSGDGTMGELWQKRWTDEYTDWFSLHDIEASAAQATVAGKHFLSDGDVALLCDSGIPILVCIADKDELMAPKDQKKLATVLGAQTYVSKGGHMGTSDGFQDLCHEIVKHILSSKNASC